MNAKTELTGAHVKAAEMQVFAERFGFTCQTEVTTSPAQYYSSGEVMLQSSTSVMLTMTDKFGLSYIVACWITYHRDDEHRESTKFMFGYRMPYSAKKKNLRNSSEVRSWLRIG